MLTSIFLCSCNKYNLVPETIENIIESVVENTIVETENDIEKTNKEEKILLAFCGDAMVHIPQAMDAYDEKTNEYNFNPCFEYVKDDIEEADYAIVNLETTLFDGEPKGFPSFSTPKEFATALRNAGFDMVTNANNHALDQKQPGIKFTLDELDKIGLEHIGSYRNEEEFNLQKGTFIKEINGIRIGFLSYSRGTNGIQLPKENKYAVNVYANKYMENVKGDVNYKKVDEALTYLNDNNVDVKIAIMHWGIENANVNQEQRDFAKYLFDHGVKIIIGSHPHIIQNLKYDDVNDNYVVYSMGNFISCQSDAKTDTTGIMYVELKKEDKLVNISDIYYKPLTMVIRERGLTPRFYVMNTHKALSNLSSKKDKKLLSLMTKDITTQMQKSIKLCHDKWGEFLDYYIKYDKKDYKDENLKSDEINEIYKSNQENDRLAPKKINYTDP